MTAGYSNNKVKKAEEIRSNLLKKKLKMLQNKYSKLNIKADKFSVNTKKIPMSKR